MRVQGIDAGFTKPSYLPGDVAYLHVATDEPSLTLRVFHSGPEQVVTYADNQFAGIEVDPQPIALDWKAWQSKPHTIGLSVPDLASGLYYVQLSGDDGRVGYAPFVIRPAVLGATSRILVVLPTNTWQAYNFQDVNGDGYGDTWYAGPPNGTVDLGRTYIARGVPPRFYRYDLPFLHWLYWSGKSAEFISDSDFDAIGAGDDLAQAYDLIVFEGHEEYVTSHEYDVVARFRDLGGNLMFLSANNFFWKVDQQGQVLRKIGEWRDAGRPEAGLIGVEYRANDDGQKQGVFTVQSATTAPWLWAGTGLIDGSTFGQVVGGYGIEIDSTTADSPPGTLVLAQIPDLLGPGITAQMSYYETVGGAKVFAAGALDFGGSATFWPMKHMLDNSLLASLGRSSPERLANLVQRANQVAKDSRTWFSEPSVAPVEIARARPEVLVRRLLRVVGHRRGGFLRLLGDRQGRLRLVDEGVFRAWPVERRLLRFDPGNAVHRLLDPRLLFGLEERVVLERVVRHVLPERQLVLERRISALQLEVLLDHLRERGRVYSHEILLL